ncbi:hypothetical protein DXG03_006710 [Asterophora parasitica]|uniref:SH3 domain-containing protein n=1 Tax=Asterophora parasitica TaxID=117018 RepID=A0A9P7GDV1_9AGAR|nr:hypothetical protein DXG03_006710 [Asterophora parasitica]
MSVDSAALLAHIISQTRQNVDFLVAQKQLSEHDGRDILLRLPISPASDPTSRIIQQTQNLDIRSNSPAAPSPVSRNTYAPSYQPPSGPPATQRAPPLFQAKANWGYNESGQNPGDLSFRAGETIDIIAETNADWWTGRHNGKEGLFPSNYVQRLSPSGAPPVPAYQEKAHNPIGGPGPHGYGPGPGPVYQSYQPPPPQGYQGGPPPHPYASYGPPPSAPVQIVQAAPPPAPAPEPEKKSGLGSSLGNTLAHSAVGGVGLGAGSAIGSGIIHSLF